MNGYNTKGGRTKTKLCGKCYLKLKREERKENGKT
jgi:hypothetical protein